MASFSRACEVCGVEFTAQRSTAKYCGATCRQRARRGSSSRPVDGIEAADAAGLVEAVRRELRQAAALDTVLGQLTLQLARRVAEAGRAESGFSTLAKEFRATRAEALGKTAPEDDPVDEMEKRREAKARAAAAAG